MQPRSNLSTSEVLEVMDDLVKQNQDWYTRDEDFKGGMMYRKSKKDLEREAEQDKAMAHLTTQIDLTKKLLEKPKNVLAVKKTKSVVEQVFDEQVDQQMEEYPQEEESYFMNNQGGGGNQN